MVKKVKAAYIAAASGVLVPSYTLPRLGAVIRVSIGSQVTTARPSSKGEGFSFKTFSLTTQSTQQAAINLGKIQAGLAIQ